MKPQIHEATTELGDKMRLRVFPRNRNVQEPTESHRKSRGRSNKRFRRRIPKHTDNMFKVISYARSKSQNASRNRSQGNCGGH